VVFKDRIEIYNPGPFPTGVTPEIFIKGNSRPVKRNPLITRTLYYSKDMESFATGLKRIYTACEKAGCRVEFKQQPYGFVVIFYRQDKYNIHLYTKDLPISWQQNIKKLVRTRKYWFGLHSKHNPGKSSI